MGEQRTVRLGFVGLGRQGLLLLKGAMELTGVRIAGMCDVRRVALDEAMGLLADFAQKPKI